jgi:hypothetical protein
VKVFPNRSGQDFFVKMNTIKRAKPSATSKVAPLENVTVYLPGDKQELDRLAKAAGTTGTNLARILIRDGLARLKSGEYKITSPPIIDNPDGSFDLHGEFADRVTARAAARGITPGAYADLAIQRGLEIMAARGFQA